MYGRLVKAAANLKIGFCRRRLSAGRQALPALAHLRMDTYARLAAGFGVGTTTAYRYATEAVELLAGLAPTPADATRTAVTKAFVILDGALLPIDGCGTVRTPYRGRWETLSTGRKAVNRSHAKIRALVEQAMATLKAWRLFRELRCSTTRITALVQAILAPHPAGSK